MKKWIQAFLAVAFVAILVQAAHASVYIADIYGNLGKVDTTTGVTSTIGNMGVALTDITADPSSSGQWLWGVDSTNLYRINALTAATTVVGSLGSGPNSGSNALVVNPSTGIVYLASTASKFLFTVDTTTGFATSVGGDTGWWSAGDLAFFNGELYWSVKSTSSSTTNHLVKLTLPDMVPVEDRGTIRLNNATGATLKLVWGLAVDQDAYGNDVLYGFSGNNTNIYSFNNPTENAFVTLAGNYGGSGLGPAYGASEAIPEPATLVVWGILGAIAVSTGWWRKCRTA
jgi:hypothetical protein